MRLATLGKLHDLDFRPSYGIQVAQLGRKPLELVGHGVRLRVHQGTLLVQNGFTHYPQKREELRLFPGDRRLPSRIIALACVLTMRGFARGFTPLQNPSHSPNSSPQAAVLMAG